MLRSAAKPLQALPAVRDGVVERYDLEARHVAVACGSHEGTPAHAAAVAEVIARAGLSLADLRPRGVHPPLAAGAARALALAGRTPTVLEHNCSGNHALMLLRESMLGRDPGAYLDPDGPAQADATEAVALACDCELVIAGDRCGMRAYSLPLRNAALGYLRLAGHGMPEPYAEAARGVAGAMREAPEMVAGPGSFDSLANALAARRRQTRRTRRLLLRQRADRARRRAQGRGRLVRGHGDGRAAPARGRRRPPGRGLRPVARASDPRRQRRARRGLVADVASAIARAQNPPLMRVFPLLVEN